MTDKMVEIPLFFYCSEPIGVELLKVNVRIVKISIKGIDGNDFFNENLIESLM